jgi:hypothetical protein
MHYIDDEV